jgi:hypothetical protein
MTETIKGILATVSGAELAELLTKQAAFHEQREAHHTTRAVKLKALTEASDQDNQQVQYTSMRAEPEYKQAEASARDHRHKALHLRFLSTHLEPTRNYALNESDLRLIGVVR